MNVIVLLGILFIGVPSSSQSWYEVDSQVSWDILDLFFVDDLHGWAIGEEGVIKTIDGGTTWEPLQGGGSTIWFWDTQHGLSAQEESILVTSNGGTTWEFLSLGLEDPKRLFFHDRDEGWLVYSDGLVKTIDGGATWENVELDLPEYRSTGKSGLMSPSCCQGIQLNNIHFSDESFGWIVGQFDYDDGTSDSADYGMAFHTKDGGITWERLEDTPCSYLGGIFGFSTGRAWAVGSAEHIYFIGNNGGLSRKHRVKSIGSETYYRCSWGYSKVVGRIRLNLFDILFINEAHGWAVGDRILSTTEGGNFWYEENTVYSDQLWLRRIRQAGERLVVVGDAGTVLLQSLTPGGTPVPSTTWGKVKREHKTTD